MLDTFTTESKSTSVLNPIPVIWNLPSVKDSISKAQTPFDGLSFCGARNYALSGNGTWLTRGTGVNSNSLILNNTQQKDISGSPYNVTLTVSLQAYPEAKPVSSSFLITITACVVS